MDISFRICILLISLMPVPYPQIAVLQNQTTKADGDKEKNRYE